MKKIIFLAVSLFLINCSNDLDVADVTPNNVKIVSSSESKLRSNMAELSDKLSNDENFKSMMKELEGLKLDLIDKKNSYRNTKTNNIDDINNKFKSASSKDDLTEFYGQYMTNPKGFVNRLEKAYKFAGSFSESYKIEISKLSENEKKDLIKSSITKFNKNNVKGRVLVNDMGCVGVCNNTWGQQENLCGYELAGGVGLATLAGMAGGPIAGSAAFLAAGFNYYVCSRSAEIDLIGCLSGC